MPKRSRTSDLMGLMFSALIHLSILAALLASPGSPPPNLEGAGGANVVSVELAGYGQPALGAPADPMDSIVSRSDRQAPVPAMSQNPAVSRPEGGGRRKLGDLAALFDSPAPGGGAATPGDDLATQIGRCFSLRGSGVPIVLQVTVAQDGRVAAQPMIMRPPMASYTAARQALEQSALAAVGACAPYRVSVGAHAQETAQVTLK
ncbi:MAG: hypothetical protein JWM33_1274 [Caulobacteraceae bacterium]|nr:hypothetical protein [Caulobacteraceae bacterium]